MPTLWRQILRKNFVRWEKLVIFLELNDSQAEAIQKAPSFPLNIPLRLAQKIKKGTLNDPILRQFLPSKEELHLKQGFIEDPVADYAFRKQSKLLHKYQGRALLVCTGACAMNCRFCFRQNFGYDVESKSFSNELQALSDDSTIQEVILSGGDPLSLSDRTLRSLLIHLSEIPHIQRIRFHTRFPIGIPERIDEYFLETLKNIRPQIWFVIHCNHPQELDEDIFIALRTLQNQGVVILNQSVLLHGVNDDVKTLKSLCELLIDHGILPYYLHQLDRVKGASHFEVPEEKGEKIVRQLMKELPGYGVPRYVREIAGEASKTPLL